MGPGIDKYDSKIADDLLKELQNGADRTIKVFYVGIAVGITVCSAIAILLYYSLWKQRKLLVATLPIFPSRFIFENRNLRGFMQK